MGKELLLGYIITSNVWDAKPLDIIGSPLKHKQFVYLECEVLEDIFSTSPR